MSYLWQACSVAQDPKAIVRLGPGSVVEIGEDSSIGPYTLLGLMGDPHGGPGSVGRLVSGRSVTINEYNNLRAGGGVIGVSNDWLISQFVSLIASGHGLGRERNVRDQSWNPDPAWPGVVSGADVWQGAGCTVLPDVTIGQGTAVTAGAVGSHDVPSYCISAGLPAWVIRQC